MKMYIFRCLLLSLVGMAVPAVAHAYDFWVDGIYYNVVSIDDQTCEVTHNGSNTYQNFLDVYGTVEYRGTTYRVIGIGERAFYGCRNLEDLTVGEGIQYIGTNAFSKLSNITKLTLPASLDSIASNAFAENTVLSSLTLKGEMMVFADYAFANYTGLKTLSIKGNVSRIGEGCFDHCSSLETLTIPSGVTQIGEAAFVCTYALTAFKISAYNTAFSVKEGVLFNKDMTTLVACPNAKQGSYAIPHGVTTIENSAFAGCKQLTTLTIPSTVSTIGFAAFNRCQSLTNLTNLALQPQDVREDDFATFGKLHVQSDSRSAYKAHDVWKKFTVVGDAKDTSPVLAPSDARTTNAAFDLSGRQTTDRTRGVVVSNGKKFVRKQK